MEFASANPSVVRSITQRVLLSLNGRAFEPEALPRAERISAWLELRPQTGRSHQLRVQLAHHKHPIYGDAKYGSIHTFGGAIALHARALTFLHPIRYEPITVTAEVPKTWRGRFAYLFREAQK